MKNIIFICMAFMFGILNISAQKVDLDPYRFNFEFRDLPHTINDSLLKTFKTTIDLSGRMEQYMTSDAVASKIQLQGFKKTETNADVELLVSFGELIVEKYQIVENVSESKNKDGVVTKSYSYYASMDYSMTGTADLHANDGSELLKGVRLFTSSTSNWASKTYNNRTEASNFYYNNKASIISQLAREKLNAGIAEANRWANYNAGFPVSTENLNLFLIANKKHPEYEAMNQRWVALKPVLEGVSANNFSADDKSKLMVMIEYFDAQKTIWNKEEKADKKIRYACYYNNALLYLLLDNPEKAMKEADGLVANDFDTKDGKRLHEKAEELLALLKKNNISTRHFSVTTAKPYNKSN